MEETFVSFEIAKKLNEKGLNIRTRYGYLPPIKIVHESFHYKDWSKLGGYPAATIPQALKWLREVKNIYVDISLRYDGWDSLILTNISTDDIGEYVYECVDRGEFPCPTYEQAAMEGIAYCLDHII